VELRAISMADLPLYATLLCDPVTMAELGGPLPREGLDEKFRRIVEDAEAGTIWYFTIVPNPADGVAVGTVCIWEHDWSGGPINEIGWMVLPSFQGRGLAGQAVDALFRRARTEGRWDVVHAFPGVTNEASNAICRRRGFTLVDERDFDYAGHTLRCNHWQIDLRSAEPA
jgi:RimJ/RimL family protein N-acetyltransferase